MTKLPTIKEVVLNLLGHNDGVEFGGGYHDECKKEAQEAHQQLSAIIRDIIGEKELKSDTKTSMYRKEVRNGLRAEQLKKAAKQYGVDLEEKE